MITSEFNGLFLVDGTGSLAKARQFAGRMAPLFRDRSPDTLGFFRGGSDVDRLAESLPVAGVPVHGLSGAFSRLARGPAHLVVLVNGKAGHPHPDPAVEMQAARFLEQHPRAALDILQVYGGIQPEMREFAASVGNIPGLFTPQRPAPAFDVVPDPTAVPKALRRFAQARAGI